MGKVTIYKWQFSIAMLVYQRLTNDEQGFRSFSPVEIQTEGWQARVAGLDTGKPR